jgi:hypothetical protein
MVSINRELIKQRILHQSNLLPMMIWAGLVLGALNSLVGLLNFVGILYIGGKDVPSLVQLEGGKSALVEPVRSDYRTNEVIEKFAEESMTQLFTWNTVQQEGQARQVADKGVEVGKGERIPTRTWQASFSISNDFREVFLQEMAASLIPQGVLSGEAQSALLIDSLTTPQEVGKGVWEVDMVAYLVIFDGQNPQGKATSFNKRIVIKAVQPALDPLPEETTVIQKAVYSTREKGLIIDEITELGAS